jgi:hypothetical protein
VRRCSNLSKRGAIISGFANFYQRFIKGFLVIAQSFIVLTCNDSTFKWTTAAQTTFDLLKQAFTIAPVVTNTDRRVDKIGIETKEET